MLARATLNGLAARVVARGPPVAHPSSGNLKNAKNYFIEAKMYKLTESVIPRQNYVSTMGVGWIFSRGGPVGDFPKIFSRGVKRGEIWFLPLEIEKTTFFANNFKIQGARPLLDPPFRRPWFQVSTSTWPWVTYHLTSHKT